MKYNPNIYSLLFSYQISDTNGNSDDMDESSYSSFYSSLIKTDSSSGRDDGCYDNLQKTARIDAMHWDKTPSPRRPWRRPDPPWLDNVNVTSDLVYRYQVTTRTITDVLQSDIEALRKIQQVLY